MTVGDINSMEKGSAARYNDGKAPLHFIPIRQWADVLMLPNWQTQVLYALAKFQEEGYAAEIYEALSCVPLEQFEEACRVFEYGAKKYAYWNWCKGQAWTVTLGSLLRHAAAGDDVDAESGLSHAGHFVCNLLMLAWYVDEYPEGSEGFFINTELKA